MCEPATIGLALGASASSAAAVGTMAYLGAGGLAMQYSQGQAAAGAQKSASEQAAKTATDTAAANKLYAEKSAFDADTAMNRANGKQPDVGSLQSKNALDAKGGVSGTMLTGPQGVDPKSLLLGKTTLLGG